MSKPIIQITIDGGMIQDIDWPDELKNLFQVAVMDFDDPDSANTGYRVNERGEGYMLSTWEDG